MNQTLRHRLLFFALAATLIAAFGITRQDDSVVVAKRSAALRLSVLPTPQKEPTPAAVPQLALPVRSAATSVVPDIFGTAAQLRPFRKTSEKPTAPLLPFNYIGRYIDAGVTYVFLEQGNQLHAVKAGDIIDDLYRIEHIDKDIHILYLPQKMRQTLAIGDML